MNTPSHQRIVFKLTPDENGYPPSDYERLWATPLPNGNFLVDNIPFFALGVSAEDEVSVQEVGDELFFDEVVKPSGISTFRLIPTDLAALEEVRAEVEKFGCKSECHRQIGLIAVEVPASASIAPFLDYLVEQQERGVLDFEEGALRHDLEE